MSSRKYLSAEGLISTIYNRFQKVKVIPRQERKNKISFQDCLMSGLAVFSLKFPSLLQYDVQRRFPAIAKNLKTLFRVNQSPSDTYMRETLDEISFISLHSAFKAILAQLQRGKILEEYQHLNQHYLISVDGTGFFSSGNVHCDQCCEKHHSDGKVSFYHQMVAAVMVHPEQKQVFPIGMEPIVKQDGKKKNDCERNAAKRLLERLRIEHPHLKVIIVEDGLAANGPHLKELQKLGMSYIIGVKPGDHEFLFDWVKHGEVEEYEYVDSSGTRHKYQFLNKIPLNDTCFDFTVNFLEYWEIDPKGKEKHFTWITNFKITRDNASSIMRGGRARWHIENNTFNTLKNQGYNFEHNYGHGKKNLSNVMAFLMLLAFLIDQAQEISCKLYQAMKKVAGTYTTLWERIRTFFLYFCWNTWEVLFTRIRDQGQWDIDTS